MNWLLRRRELIGASGDTLHFSWEVGQEIPRWFSLYATEHASATLRKDGIRISTATGYRETYYGEIQLNKEMLGNFSKCIIEIENTSASHGDNYRFQYMANTPLFAAEMHSTKWENYYKIASGYRGTGVNVTTARTSKIELSDSVVNYYLDGVLVGTGIPANGTTDVWSICRLWCASTSILITKIKITIE